MIFHPRLARFVLLAISLAVTACTEKDSSKQSTTLPTSTPTPVGGATATPTTVGYGISGRLWTNAASTIRLADGRGHTTDVTVTSTSGTAFSFPAAATGATYSVSIAAAHPAFQCQVLNGSGTIAGANVSNIAVVCLITSGGTSGGGGGSNYRPLTVGGTVTGLTGTLGLANSRGDGIVDTATVTTNGFGYFQRLLNYGTSYNVYVTSQPAGQTCTVSYGQGVAYASVTNIQISCVTNVQQYYLVGGSVSGLLTGKTVKLRNNGGDEITLSTNGSFTFPTQLLNGSYYNVTVQEQPVGETCLVYNGAGTILSSQVYSVFVSCTPNPAFTLAGNFAYQDPPAVNGTGGAQGTYPHVAYESSVVRPARRISVLAYNGTDVVAEGRTNDLGNFSLTIPAGNSVQLIFLAEADSGPSYVPDGVGGAATDKCNGAQYLYRSVDNTDGYATYGVISGFYSATNTSIALQASTTHDGDHYLKRGGIPFNSIEVALTAQELICSARPTASTGELQFMISERNRVSDDFDPEEGRIGFTQFFVWDDGTAAITLPGQEDGETDDLDDANIAHEIGHFFEYSLYRSDSLGGSHSNNDVLDSTVAFSEGFGYAFAGLTLNDPIIVDTYGDDQASGFIFDISVKPGDRTNIASQNDRGYYSENSVAYLLWQLGSRRGNFGRLNTALTNMITSFGQQNALTFGATYISLWGRTAETFQTLWETDLDMPIDALCVGSCLVASPTADFFDTDGDIGARFGIASSIPASRRLYPQPRVYPIVTGAQKDARFWNPYRALNVAANVAQSTFLSTAHEVIDFGNYASPGNKLGANRGYVFTAPQTRTYRLSITNPVGATCTQDTIDLIAYKRGVEIASDFNGSGPRAGCPFVEVSLTAGDKIILNVSGYDLPQLQGWDVVVDAL